MRGFMTGDSEASEGMNSTSMSLIAGEGSMRRGSFADTGLIADAGPTNFMIVAGDMRAVMVVGGDKIASANSNWQLAKQEDGLAVRLPAFYALGAFLSFRMRPFGMLAGETSLKLLDLFFDFLFAVASGEENVVGIGDAFLSFAVATVPEGRIVLFIALHDGGELVIGLRAGQFEHDFLITEVFLAKNAKTFQALQAGQGDFKASVEKVKGLVKMDFGGKRAAHILRHSASARKIMGEGGEAQRLRPEDGAV
jgi:hypothetical protein